jgi:phage FluMu protein Com
MPITASCPGCGKAIAAPETAAGRKARCPQCGGVVEIPAAPSPVTELAAALSRAAGAGAVADAGPAAEPPSASRTPTPRSGSGSSSRTSTTTVDRMLARSSPYRTLRLLAAVTFGAGVALALIALVGGLVALVLISTAGNPLTGVAVFAGALAAALGFFLAAKILNEMLGLWADVGDRMRQMSQTIEDLASRTRDNGI